MGMPYRKMDFPIGESVRMRRPVAISVQNGGRAAFHAFAYFYDKGMIEMENRYLEDKRLSLLLFGAVWLLYVIVYMTKNCYSAAMAAIVSEGILTKTQTGAITAVFYTVYAAFQIPGGAAADRFSPGKLILIGVLGAGAANLVIYFNQNYMVMMTTWALNAAVQFGVWPAVFKIVSSKLAKEHRRKGVFYIATASAVGLIISYIFAAVVSRWQYNFLISAVLLFAVAAGWYFLWRAMEARMTAEEGRSQPAKRMKELRRFAPKRKGFASVFMTSGLLLLLVATVIRCMLDLGVKALTPVMLMESYEQISPSLASVLNTLLIIAGIFGLFLARFLFPRRIRDEASTMALLLAAAIPFFAMVALLGKIPVWTVMGALVLAIAFNAGAGQMGTCNLATRFADEGRNGMVAGLFNAGASLGIVIANYGFAKMADCFGWALTTQLWAVLAVFAAALSAAAIPLWKRFLRKKEVQSVTVGQNGVSA